MKVGLISDTHGFLDEKVLTSLRGCDEIWHAGDLGPGVAEKLSAIGNFRAVYGNIDDLDTRNLFPEFLEINEDGLRILITHIAGKPPKYNTSVRSKIKSFEPHVLICGHSHMACVIKDPDKNNMIFINPGAAGIHGFHQIRTLMTFQISNGKISDLALVEIGKRGEIKDSAGVEYI